MSNELISLGLKEAASKIKSRDISAVELAKAYLNRIEERNEAINAYITVTGDEALAMAAESDKRVKEGKARLLEGVPLGVKDLFCTQGVLTTAGSHILDGFVPHYESFVTNNLWHMGATMLGKLNLDQFGMGTSNENSHYGPVRNPWDTARTPGGSSGGTSAAVADFQCAAALGTDTGGSCRQPAAFTGTVGLKPTYGRCSRWGVVAYASSLDCPSLIGRSTEDVALLLRGMAGHDVNDSTSADMPIENYDEKLDELPLKGLRIGLPKEYFIEGLDPNIKVLIEEAASRFEAQGAIVKEISLPHTTYGLAAYYIITPAEAATNLARYDGMRYGLRVEGDNLAETYKQTRSQGFGDEVKRRIMIGNYALSSGYYDAYYSQAQKVRALIKQDFMNAFEEVDVIFTPTTPTPAFKIGEKINDPIQLYLADAFTVSAPLAGVPALSVPAGTIMYEGQKLPVGLQIIGKHFAERQLLQVAYAHEQLTKFQPLMVEEAQ